MLSPLSQEKLNWQKTALIFFFAAAILGVLLRFAFVIQMPEWFKYKNIQHAHSHAAMMGWLSAGFYLLICHWFQLNRPIYKRVFWASQATVLGMLISFPVQGYAFFSILLSTAYMILNYIFIVAVLKDIRLKELGQTTSVRFLKTALFFMAFSTIGLWAMAPIMASGLRGTALYYASVQFFLHFQFNGWFTFALLALMFEIFKRYHISIDGIYIKWFYGFLFVSCLMTYALSVTWSTPDRLLFWVNSIGVLFQAIALVYFMKILASVASKARAQFSQWHYLLWGIAFFCLGFKILIQTLVAVPYLATVSYTIRNFVIGFIHLLMLGAFSTFLFGLMDLNKKGIIIFLGGIVLTELLLFGQGILLWLRLGFIPHYHLILALVSMLLLIGVGIILFFSPSPERGDS